MSRQSTTKISEPGHERSGRAVVESVLRATKLLECYRHGEPELSLAELVRRGGYSKTTTYRLLTTLEVAGWLERTDDATFRLTLRPFQIGSIVLDSLDLRREAAPVMRRLSEQADHSVYLTIPAGVHAVCIERIDRGQGVRVMDLHVGGSQPLHIGAAPRALLAHHEDDLLPELLRFGLEARTPASLSTVDALLDDLEQPRRRGYSISDSDATVGVAALGAPVFDVTERAVASISIGGLSEQLLPPQDQDVSLLLSAATDISARLGSRRPRQPVPRPASV
jgi:DNA-binding IclR family transcriptional regulator